MEQHSDVLSSGQVITGSSQKTLKSESFLFKHQMLHDTGMIHS